MLRQSSPLFVFTQITSAGVETVIQRASDQEGK